MNNKKALVLPAIFLSILLFSQEKRTVIEPIKNEKWWGLSVRDGVHTPFKSGYKSSATSVQDTPLLISNAGRYIWDDNKFDFEINDNDELVIISEKESIVPVKAGKTLREAFLVAYNQHFQQNNITPKNDFFVMPQYDISSDSNQEDILKFCSDMKSNGVGDGIVVINSGWQNYNGSLIFDRYKFPDAESMIKKLHEDGFKILLNVSPFISPDSPQFRELRNKNFLLKDIKTKSIKIVEWDGGYSAVYDFGNPDAYQYLKDKLDNINNKYHIDGFKFGEGYVNDSYDYITAWNNLASNYEYNIVSSANNHHTVPIINEIAIDGTWKDFQNVIPKIINSGLIGYPYFNITLKEGAMPENDLFALRYAQLQSFMPIFSVNNSMTKHLDQSKYDFFKNTITVRRDNIDYIKSLIKESSETGAPIIRSMEYEFPGKGFNDCNDQFMLGNKYLVAPFLTENSDRIVRLPNGRWIDDKGVTHKGPMVINIKSEENRVPYFEYKKSEIQKIISKVKKRVSRRK